MTTSHTAAFDGILNKVIAGLKISLIDDKVPLYLHKEIIQETVDVIIAVHNNKKGSMTTVTYQGEEFTAHVANGLPWARISDAQAILFDNKQLYYTWLEGQE